MNLDRAIAKATTITTRDMRVPVKRFPEELYGPFYGTAVIWSAAGILEVLHLFGGLSWEPAWAVFVFGAITPVGLGILIAMLGVATGAIRAWKAIARPIRRYRRVRRAREKYALGHHTLAALELAVERALDPVSADTGRPAATERG